MERALYKFVVYWNSYSIEIGGSVVIDTRRNGREA